ncbi:12634_t:CDS:1, partial [Racocetra fulgida]
QEIKSSLYAEILRNVYTSCYHRTRDALSKYALLGVNKPSLV